MTRMTNFRSAAIATGNAVNDSAYDTIVEFMKVWKEYGNIIPSIVNASTITDTDVNTLTDGSTYFVSGNSNINLPTTEEGYLRVITEIPSFKSIQIFIDIKGYTYVREAALTNGIPTWGSWVSFDANNTTIIQGHGVPSKSINPFNGTNAMYVDIYTNTSYICKDATTDNNIWTVNGSGQFADIGTSIGKGVGYMAQETDSGDTTIKAGTNGYSIDSLVIPDGGSITIESDAVYKVL